MASLKDQANIRKLKLKHDAKLIKLEKERNFFRTESLKLNKLYKE